MYRFLTPTSTTNDFFREAQVYLQGEDMANRRRAGHEGQPPQLVLQIKTDEPRTSSQIQRNPEATNFVTKTYLEKFEKILVES